MEAADSDEPQKENKPPEKHSHPYARELRGDAYHRRQYLKESSGTIEKKRKEARDVLLKTGILQLLDERKKYLRDHDEDESAAIDIGIIPSKGGDLYVGVLRWDAEELKKDVLASKVVRIIFDPAQQSAAVSYIAKNDNEQLEWRTHDNPVQLSDTLTGTFTSANFHDTILEAVELADGKIFDNRKMVNGVLSANPPGIGRIN